MQVSYTTRKEKNENLKLIYLCISTFSLLFVIIPIVISFIQLHKSIREWIIDIETRRIVGIYVRNHLKSLYLISLLFGSCFAAIEITNSNMFHLDVFDMGLNRRQKAIFKNQRLLSTVLLEVM